MGKSWSSKHEFSLLSGELATSEDRDFERRSLPLIRAIWPEAIAPPSRRSFDQSGVDHLVWSDVQPFPLVIQCKGFRSNEHEIGSSQIKQCLDSVQSFKKSGLKARIYVLIHNRDGRNKNFRSAIQNELEKLVFSGQVDQALLWDRQTFLKQAFDKTLERAISLLGQLRSDALYYTEIKICEPLEIVPLSLSELVINQYRLERQFSCNQKLGDPSKEILEFDESTLVLLIAEAGYGKTTTALRSFASGKRKIFYVPASKISRSVIGAKDLLFECIDLEEMIVDVEDADRVTQRRLLRPVIEYLLKDSEQPLVLILDGLDESIYFSRPGGLQALFNHLRDVKIPVVLLARSEFWKSRLEDFSTSFGLLSQKGDRRRTRIKLIELTPWSAEQIAQLAERFQNTLTVPEQKMRISHFINVVKSGEYKKFYGDIPRSPLFLRFILETVVEQDVRRIGRARLYYDWAYLKISRDISRPRQFGGQGRPPILFEFESADVTLRLSFRAMMLAAATMTTLQNGTIELLSSCKLTDVLLRDPELKQVHDPTGLFLNSLLSPLPMQMVHQDIIIRFAHRTYQEFFLALYYAEYPDQFNYTTLPKSIVEMLNNIKKEGIINIS